MFYEPLQQTHSQMTLLDHFQTQKQICGQYIKLASQQLYLQQAEIISKANELLEKVATKEAVKDLSEWDVFSTRDSVVLEDQSSMNLSTFSQESRGRKIQRKSGRCPRMGRQFDSALNDSLAQVQELCTEKTCSTVKKAVEQYRKLKMRVFEYEKKQKTMRSQQKLVEQLHQKNSVLARKIDDSELTIGKLKNESNSLKATITDLSQKLHQKETQINSQKKLKLMQEKRLHQSSSSIKNQSPRKDTSFDLIQDMMNEKQALLSSRFQKIKQVELKVQRQLFDREGCGRCCELLQRMKGAVVSYRGYLQQESQQFQQFVDKFKNKIQEFDDQC